MTDSNTTPQGDPSLPRLPERPVLGIVKGLASTPPAASAGAASLAVPEGWKPMPHELTDDMLIAACDAGHWRVTGQSIKDVRAAYAAMLAAAPSQLTAEEREVRS